MDLAPTNAHSVLKRPLADGLLVTLESTLVGAAIGPTKLGLKFDEGTLGP